MAKNTQNKIGFLGEDYQYKLVHEFIEDKEWKKLSLYDKIRKRFAFKEYKQNIYDNKWRLLSKEDKNKFIIDKAKWRIQKAKELRFSKEDIKLHIINNFFYYENRDANGMIIDMTGLDLVNYNKLILNDANIKWLKEFLVNADKENKIPGFIIINKKIIMNNGKAWFNKIKNIDDNKSTNIKRKNKSNLKKN